MKLSARAHGVYGGYDGVQVHGGRYGGPGEFTPLDPNNIVGRGYDL
jgi:hypothetical protein